MNVSPTKPDLGHHKLQEKKSGSRLPLVRAASLLGFKTSLIR